MALKRLVIDGYGQLELNNAPFRRDGSIEAQCKIDDTIDFVENGMLLVVDSSARKVKYSVDNSEPLIALNYSAEHMYDERTPGLKNFKLDRGTFLPRLGYLSVGTKFTTNTIAYDSDDFADDDAVIAAAEAAGTTALYGQACANGAIEVTATKPTGTVCLKAVKATTMPDGQFAIQFISLK